MIGYLLGFLLNYCLAEAFFSRIRRNRYITDFSMYWKEMSDYSDFTLFK